MDAILQTKEWIDGDSYMQLREFLHDAGHDFILRATGQPDIKASTTSFNASVGDGSFQGFGVHLDAPLASGVRYSIIPLNQGHAHSWRVAAGLGWTG